MQFQNFVRPMLLPPGFWQAKGFGFKWLMSWMLILVTAGNLQAQSPYRIAEEIKFHNGNSFLDDPMGGGINNAEISDADLNGDGLMDLAIYDKAAYKMFAFLNTGTVSSPSYRHSSDLDTVFPPLTDWALMRDFNCDGIADLVSYSGASSSVWLGKRHVDGQIYFEFFTPKLFEQDGPDKVPIFTSRVDIPAFDDINGDGDIDLLTFGTFGGYIRYFENRSIENGWGCDSLIFEKIDLCWGAFYEGPNCHGGDLNSFCKGGLQIGGTERKNPDINVPFSHLNQTVQNRMHSGSTLCAIDHGANGVMDLLLGDVSCENLVFLRNGGSTAAALITAQDTMFPSYNQPVQMPYFNAAFKIDFDRDGLTDVLIAPNDDNDGRNINNVLFYKNLSSDSFNLSFQTDSLLVGHMVDVGAYSKPVLFDYNEDGLLDLLVGSQYALGADNQKSYGLWLFENTGAVDSPSFVLKSRDYASMAVYELENLAPAIGDLDSDGDIDLLLGDATGNLHYLENTAGPGATAVFNTPVFNYKGINKGVQATPFLFDVNKDGLLDLIVGERNGILAYFRNFGSASSPEFIEETDFFGAVDTRKAWFPTGNSQPLIYVNDLGAMELLSGSQSGFIYRYNNLDGNLLGTFNLIDSAWLGIDNGFYSGIALGDINADGKPELIAGNIRGGLTIYTELESPPVGISEPESLNSPKLQLFPNPASDNLVVRLERSRNEAAQIRLMDVGGRTVYNKSIAAFTEQVNVDLSNFSSGVYFCILDLAGNSHRGKFAIVR